MSQLEKFREDIHACRYCFMCRHLSAVGNVRFSEADTPRVRALIADLAMRDPAVFAAHPEYVETFYDSELSGANRFHCVEHYDEVGIVLAFRRDAISAGVIPERVKTLAAELRAEPVKSSGSGDFVYIASGYAPADDAVKSLLKKRGIAHRTVTGAEAAAALAVLGFDTPALPLDGAKTVLCGSPAVAWLLRERQGCTRTVDEWLAAEFPARPGRKTPAAYLPSDYLKNYLQSPAIPAMLAALGLEPVAIGANAEESYAAGEGAVVLDRLNPALVKQLALRVVEALPPDVPVVAGSPYTARILNENGVAARTTAEMAAALC